jgi:hypothetical protein
MQQELKYEAYRMEAIRKAVETTCFDRCIPAPGNALEVLGKALPDKLPFIGTELTPEQQMQRYDLSESEAVCVDRCTWKYMMTAKICMATLNKSKNIKDPAQPKM